MKENIQVIIPIILFFKFRPGDRGRWARRPAYGPSRARVTGSEPASEPGTPGRADRDCEFQPESVTAAPAAVEVRSGEADSEARWE